MDCKHYVKQEIKHLKHEEGSLLDLECVQESGMTLRIKFVPKANTKFEWAFQCAEDHIATRVLIQFIKLSITNHGFPTKLTCKWLDRCGIVILIPQGYTNQYVVAINYIYNFDVFAAIIVKYGWHIQYYDSKYALMITVNTSIVYGFVIV